LIAVLLCRRHECCGSARSGRRDGNGVGVEGTFLPSDGKDPTYPFEASTT
jgi:hypothetical protein